MTGLISKILRKPSQRTQYEASLTGITFLLLGGLGVTFYMVFFTQMSVWFKVLTIFGGIGIFLLMGSNLVMTYLQYYTFKMQMGLYPIDELLIQKINEAKDLIKELNKLIDDNSKIEKGGKRKCMNIKLSLE